MKAHDASSRRTLAPFSSAFPPRTVARRPPFTAVPAPWPTASASSVRLDCARPPRRSRSCRRAGRSPRLRRVPCGSDAAIALRTGTRRRSRRECVVLCPILHVLCSPTVARPLPPLSPPAHGRRPQGASAPGQRRALHHVPDQEHAGAWFRCVDASAQGATRGSSATSRPRARRATYARPPPSALPRPSPPPASPPTRTPPLGSRAPTDARHLPPLLADLGDVQEGRGVVLDRCARDTRGAWAHARGARAAAFELGPCCAVLRRGDGWEGGWEWGGRRNREGLLPRGKRARLSSEKGARGGGEREGCGASPLRLAASRPLFRPHLAPLPPRASSSALPRPLRPRRFVASRGRPRRASSVSAPLHLCARLLPRRFFARSSRLRACVSLACLSARLCVLLPRCPVIAPPASLSLRPPFRPLVFLQPRRWTLVRTCRTGPS